MAIVQEIPILQNKLFSFVGAKDLEMDAANQLQDLLLSLKGFIFSLETQLHFIKKLEKKEIEEYYNIIYQTIDVFSKINKKLDGYNYFDNDEIKTYFEQIIKKLKKHRKELLLIIEGDLLEISKYSANSNAYKQIQKT